MIPEVELPHELAEDIYSTLMTDHAKAERCGVLLGTFEQDRYMISGWAEVPNTSKTPDQTFEIRTDDVKGTLKDRFGYVDTDHFPVIGSVHTHYRGTGADPSYADVLEQPSGTLGCVVHETTGIFTFYTEEHGFVFNCAYKGTRT